MYGIEGVEERLRAIEWEIAQLRTTSTPGYMRLQGLERIEEQVKSVRQELSDALADLSAFYRVASIVGGRIGSGPVQAWLQTEIRRTVQTSVGEAFTARDQQARVRDALDGFLAGGAIDGVTALWPWVRQLDPSSPHALHTLRLALAAHLEKTAEIDRSATALLEWAMMAQRGDDATAVRGKSGVDDERR